MQEKKRPGLRKQASQEKHQRADTHKPQHNEKYQKRQLRQSESDQRKQAMSGAHQHQAKTPQSTNQGNWGRNAHFLKPLD